MRKQTRASPQGADARSVQGRKQNQMAKEALATAVKLDPELAEAYTNLGIALQDLGEGEEAERMTGMAVRLKPDMAAGHNNHGRALENNNKLEAALSSYNKALKFSGQGYSDAFCAKVYLEHFLCAWDTLDQDMAQVAVNLQQNLAPQYAAAEPCVQPFRAFAYALPPTLFMNVTIKVVEQERARVPDGGKKSVLKLSGNHHQLLAEVSTGGPGRLRVAYMSSDFGGHTVGSLIRNLLKLHNRKRAEICGVGMMKGDGTEWNMEMEASSDRWLSIDARCARAQTHTHHADAGKLRQVAQHLWHVRSGCRLCHRRSPGTHPYRPEWPQQRGAARRPLAPARSHHHQVLSLECLCVSLSLLR